MTTKIASWGNGLGLHLPKSIVTEMGLAVGSEVKFRLLKDGGIAIEPVKKTLSLKEILSRAKPGVKYTEYWNDIPQGREIW